MKILFAGGGTAGHINPALAVAGYIKERHPDAEISYIGTAEKLEAKLVPEKGYDFHTIDVAGFQRKITPENIIKNISIDQENDDSMGADFYEISKLNKNELSEIAYLELTKLGFKISEK